MQLDFPLVDGTFGAEISAQYVRSLKGAAYLRTKGGSWIVPKET